MTNGDLISREAWKKSLRKSINERYPKWTKTITVADIATLIFDEIDNAPTVEVFTENDKALAYCEGYVRGSNEAYVRPQGECKACDYYKFAQSFINGIVEVISKNGLTSIDELLEILNREANKNE